MTGLDTRFVAYAVWGLGTVLLYTVVLIRARRAYTKRRDRRARRDLIGSFALFITALASFLAITGVLWGPVGTGIRGFLVALALGAFFAAGIVMAFAPTQERPDGA